MIYGNTSDKESDCKTRTDLFPSDATSDDPTSMRNLTVILEGPRIQSYIKKEMFIPPGNRCYTNHILKNRIYEGDLGHFRVYSNTTSLSASELSNIMETLSIKCDSTLLDKIDKFNLSEK